MATPLTFNPDLTWLDVTDDNNVPAGAKPVDAASIIRWEQGIDAATRRINEHDETIIAQGQTLSANGSTLTTLGSTVSGHTSSITALTGRVDDLTMGAAAVQHAPTTALTTAIPTAVTTINAALTAAFKVPDSGRVLLELSQYVKITTKGELRWVIADSANLNTIRSTLAVANDVVESYVTARALITGLTANADMSWVWRHQLLSPGVGALQIDSVHPALMTIRAA